MELIIVIVLIGILSAVAFPRFADVTGNARLAKQQATLGMLKASWSTARGIYRRAPTCAEVVAQANLDPVCTGTTSITCAGVTKKDGTGLATFTCVDSAAFPNITCADTGC